MAMVAHFGCRSAVATVVHDVAVMCRCETERQKMREEEDTICVEMMRKLWWLTQIYFRMGATPARSMADGAGRKTRGGREAGAGMNCASLWFSAAMDLCVWRAAAFSGKEDGREVVADMEMEARVWEVEGDDVAICYWLNFELLDHARGIILLVNLISGGLPHGMI